MKWKTRALAASWIAVFVVVGGVPCHAQSDPPAEESEAKSASPLQRSWYEDQGIELPRRFGIGLNFVFMEPAIVDMESSNGPIDHSFTASLLNEHGFEIHNRSTRRNR